MISDFGMQIDCYKKGVNAENETVLFYDAESSGKAMFDQIVRAYRELADYLNGNDSEILNSVRLDRVAYVMKHLWKVGSSYDELSD